MGVPVRPAVHNASVREGWEIPEEHVRTTVDIRNFSTEEDWQEILKLEPPCVAFALPFCFQVGGSDFSICFG